LSPAGHEILPKCRLDFRSAKVDDARHKTLQTKKKQLYGPIWGLVNARGEICDYVMLLYTI